jgi:hypothetical protein
MLVRVHNGGDLPGPDRRPSHQKGDTANIARSTPRSISLDLYKEPFAIDQASRGDLPLFKGSLILDEATAPPKMWRLE